MAVTHQQKWKFNIVISCLLWHKKVTPNIIYKLYVNTNNVNDYTNNPSEIADILNKQLYASVSSDPDPNLQINNAEEYFSDAPTDEVI